MIKNSLKNFCKNLLYVFIPMGIVYLFLLIAVFSVIGVTFNAANTAVNSTFELIGSSAEHSQKDAADFLSYAFGQIDWSGNPLTILKTVLKTSWLADTIKGFVAPFVQSTEGFDEQLNAIISNFKDSLSTGVTLAATLVVVGVVCANYATRFAVRRKVAKRNFKQFVIAYVVVPIFQTALLAFALWLLATIKLYSLLAFVALIIILGVLSLCTSYLIYGSGLKLKDVLTFKNILKHFAVLCIMAALNILLAWALWQLSPLFALLLMIPLVIYSANIVDVNTDSYVCNLAAELSRQEKQPS